MVRYAGFEPALAIALADDLAPSYPQSPSVGRLAAATRDRSSAPARRDFSRSPAFWAKA
jgi:hypothetical protein